MATLALADPVVDVSLARYARIAGVAMLLSIIFGAIGEAWIPGRIIVAGDAAATAANIVNHPVLFRLGFATYLVEGICDAALCVFFYVVLKPVNRNLALLSAFFGIASMVTFATAQSSWFAASVILRDVPGMDAFSADQRATLAFYAIRLSGSIAWLFVGLYGTATIIRGWLIIRSGYLPRALGALFVIGGIGFVLKNATFILAPALSSGLLLAPMALAGVPMMLWLLIRGVDEKKLVAQ